MSSFAEKLHKNGGKPLPIIIGIIAVGFSVGVLFAATKSESNFNPKFDTNQGSGVTAAIDQEAFDSSQNSDNGLAADENTDDAKNLNDGNDQMIQNQNQNGNGLTLADGTGNGTGTNGIGTSSGLGGPTIIVPSGGTGGNNDSGTGGGTGDSGGSGGAGGNSGDNEKYGTDYNSSETVDTFSPPAGVTIEKVKVTAGSLMQHFYCGEAPRIEEMAKYITVTAFLSDGTTHDLNYCPSMFNGTGGDYIVMWGTSTEENKIGYPKVPDEPGKYKAKIIVLSKTQTITVDFDVVDWEVNLLDFDESAMAEVDENYSTLGDTNYPHGTVSPDNSPIIDLENPFQDMYDIIAERTDYNAEATGDKLYKHINDITIDEYFQSTCTAYFGGWSETNDEDGLSVGKFYKIPRPTDKQLSEDGLKYEVTLYPTMEIVPEDSDYVISMQEDVMGFWQCTLTDYIGDDTILVIPEGVDEVAFSPYAFEHNSNLDKITKVVIPESLTSFGEDYWNPGLGWDDVFPNLEEFEVALNNQNYIDIDGVLYNKTGKTLLCVPSKKTSIDRFSSKVTVVLHDAFKNTTFDKITLPESVTYVQIYAFNNAAIGTLELTTPGKAELGFGEGMDDDFNYIQETIFGATGTPLKVDNVIVQDTEDDSSYIAYLKSLVKNLEFNYGETAGFDVLNTSENAKSRYTYEDGMLYSNDESVLYSLIIQPGGEDLEIPDTIKKIHNSAFLSVDESTTIYMTSTTPPEIGNYIFGFSLIDNVKIAVPTELYDTYYEAYSAILDAEYGEGATASLLVKGDKASLFKEDGSTYRILDDNSYALVSYNTAASGNANIKDGTTVIEDGAFKNCYSLQTVILPESLKELGNNLFENCFSLEMIAFNGKTLPELKGDTFTDVSAKAMGVSKYKLPTSNSDGYQNLAFTETDADYFTTDYSDAIGIYGVNDTDYILEYVMSTVDADYETSYYTTQIASGVFKDNENIEKVTLSSSITKIGSDSFDGSSITELTINNLDADFSTFANCSSLTCLCLGEYIEDDIKADDSRLESFHDQIQIVEFGCTSDSITGNFNDWNSLVSFYMAESSTITTLGGDLFKEKALTEIQLSSSVSTVEAGCFDGCVNCATYVEVNSYFDYRDGFPTAMKAIESFVLGPYLYADTVTTDWLTPFKEAGELDIYGYINNKLTGSFADWTYLQYVWGIGSLQYQYSGHAYIAELDDSLFENCPELMWVDLGDVGKIGKRCFANCPKFDSTNPEAWLGFYYYGYLDIDISPDAFAGIDKNFIVYVNHPGTFDRSHEDDVLGE